jgi:hypothetical protein
MPAPLIAAAGRALMAKLLKSGLTRKESAGLVEQAMGSKFVRDALTKSAKTPKKSSDIGGGLVAQSTGSKFVRDALTKGEKTRKNPTSAGLVEEAMGSKFVRDALTKSAKTPKKMEKGGEVRASRKSARKSIDGCAVRGKTRAVKNV